MAARPTSASGRVVVVRHGETAWSREGRHTGRTDLELEPAGEVAARSLAPVLAAYRADLVLASPLVRAWRTAELAGLEPEPEPDLMEWDYGAWEGRSGVQIAADLGVPGWRIWDQPVPGGEQLDSVAARCRRVLDRCAPVLNAGGSCLLVAHAHVLRVLAVTWVGLTASDAQHLLLGAACRGELTDDRGTPVIDRWNLSPADL